jgi:DNA-binding HxlR family transcriptional regulator
VKLEKTTKRSYDDACGAAHALDLVGERWALLVIRELMLGPKRFSDLRAGLPGISANVLTQRLEGLEAAGVLIRRRLPPPAATQVYELTPWGYEAEPIFQVLGRWAARSPTHDPSLPLSAASLILSFRTMFEPGRAGDWEATIGLKLGSESFRIRIGGGGIEAGRGSVEGAQLILAGSAPAVAGIVYGGQSINEFERQGLLEIKGDRALLDRFVTLFPLPDKVEAS